MRNSLQSVTA